MPDIFFAYLLLRREKLDLECLSKAVKNINYKFRLVAIGDPKKGQSIYAPSFCVENEQQKQHVIANCFASGTVIEISKEDFDTGITLDLTESNLKLTQEDVDLFKRHTNATEAFYDSFTGANAFTSDLKIVPHTTTIIHQIFELAASLRLELIFSLIEPDDKIAYYAIRFFVCVPSSEILQKFIQKIALFVSLPAWQPVDLDKLPWVGAGHSKDLDGSITEAWNLRLKAFADYNSRV